MELFSLEKVSFRFPDYHSGTYEEQPYRVKDVSFSIRKGDFVTLAGPTGCGKSTLLRLLKRELTPRGELSGTISYNKKELIEYKEGELTAKIGYVMQDPEHQCVTDKVWHELAFGLENMGVNVEQMHSRCAEMASYFGMDEWLDKEVYTLSGGQKQLLNLASVLVMGPDILLLDEPTSQLDPIAAENFIHTIKKLNEETGITILMVEHRLESVLPLADQVLLMEKGRIVFDGRPEELPTHLSAFSSFKAAMPCSIRLYMEYLEESNETKCPLTVVQGKRYLEQHYQNTIEKDYSLKKGVAATHITGKRETCLELKKLMFRYEKKGKDVLRETNLSLYEGEIFCLLGANGSGKSTALKCAAGILKPYAGKVKCSKTIAYLPQDVETVFVTDEVGDDLKLVGFKETESEFPFDIKDLLHQHPYDLSGGEKQKVALAKILAKGADVLLLDEPAKGLDANAKLSLIALLTSLKQQGKSILLVTHDVEFAALVGDRSALFYRGEIVSSGRESSFFANNSFYTTAAARIAKNFYTDVVTTEELLYMCKKNGGYLE